MNAIDIPPAPPLHAHALPQAIRARQMLRQRVTDAERALDEAEHAEALAVLATARARRALAHWREQLEAAEREAT